MNPAVGIQSFIEFIIKSLAREPDQAFVVHETIDNRVVFTIEVAEADIDRLMGKEGRGIAAIRHLSYAAAAMHDFGVEVRLTGEKKQPKRFASSGRRDVRRDHR